MRILNFTGKQIRLSNAEGNVLETLPSDGNAYCDIIKKPKAKVNFVTIYKNEYGRVCGLPDPDRNLEKLYIVNKDVAKAASPRFDLLVAEEPLDYEGSTYYKYLVNM